MTIGMWVALVVMLLFVGAFWAFVIWAAQPFPTDEQVEKEIRRMEVAIQARLDKEG